MMGASRKNGELQWADRTGRDCLPAWSVWLRGSWQQVRGSVYLTRLLSILLFLLFLTTNAPAGYFLTQTYTELEGLPSNLVNNVTQTADGCIWLATRNGITWYDGISWKQPSEKNKPEGADFRLIEADRKGRIWTVSRGLVASYRKDGIWYSLPRTGRKGISTQSITGMTISEWDEDAVAVSTSHDGAFVFINGSWHHLGLDTGFPSDNIMDIKFFGDHLLLATNSGLFAVDKKLQMVDIPLTQLEFPTSAVAKIQIEYMNPPDVRHEMIPRRIWIIGNPWLGYYENGAFTLFKRDVHLIVPDKMGAALRMQPDYAGGVVCSVEATTIHFDAFGNQNLLGAEQNIATNGASCLYLDREFCFWIGNNRGLTKIPSFRFTNYSSEEGLLEDEVSSIQEISPGKTLFGHNGGYTIVEDTLSTKVPYSITPSAPNNITRVLDIAQVDEDNYWFAINAAGMYQVRLSDNKFSWYPKPFTEQNFASATIVTHDDRVLAGAGKGLYEYNEEKDRFLLSPLVNEVDLFVRSLLEGPNNELYLGTAKQGLMRLQEGVLTKWSSSTSPLANRLYSVYCDPNGTVFAGTLDGPQVVENGELVPFREDVPFRHRPTYCIFRDPDGRLWFGTDNGVFIYDGSQTLHYTRIHGLSGLEVNRRAHMVDEQGRVWVGTSSGVSMYQRRYDFTHRIPDPEVKFVSIQSGAKRFAPDQHPNFNSNENTITAEFNFVSLIDESQNKFRYWLEGDGDGWSQPQPMRSNLLRFTNLAPGSYTLHLEACDALGKWSGQIHSNTITVMPPFWRTWWFLFLVMVTVLSTLVLIYRLFLQQRYSTLLRSEVQEKTAELIHHRDRLEEVVQQRTSELSLSNEALRGEIVKREVIQQEVERHHTHLMSIFNGVHDAIVTVDTAGTITKANQGFSQLFQLEDTVVEGKRLVDIVPVDNVLKAVADGRDVRGWLAEVTDRSTGELLLKVNAQPLPSEEDANSEIMVVMSDVTRLYHLEKEVADRKSYHNIIGQNPKMQAIYSMIEDLSTTLATVLITGESGTGKELVASALHHSSIRSEGPFIALNCAALSETILESELFGHVKGAFTSAVKDRAGRFEAARGGTLFLDEIGEMPMSMQVKLLRVLETGEFERVGDTVTLKTDARIISATNRDLLKRVDEGEFRKDLYYRLNVIHLHLPPLRERAEDIPLLARYFVQMFADEADPPVSNVSPEALELLINANWPGNVRELKHQIQRACLICRDGVLQPSHFRELVQSTSHVPLSKSTPEQAPVAAPNGSTSSNGGKTHRAPEREELLANLELHDWNIQQTANDLGLSRQTIYRKIREFDLKRP